MKKLMVGLAPLLAVAAFMVVPAMASANGPSWEACTKVGAGLGTYKTSSCTTTGGTKSWEWELVGRFPGINVVSKNVAGVEAKLEVAALGSGIICKKVADESAIWNSGPLKIGEDENYVTFSECRTFGALLTGCTVAEPIVVEADTLLEEKAGIVYNKYTPSGPQPFTEITFAGTCELAGATLPVEGFANGEVSGNKQKFNNTTGSKLTLGPFEAEFEAETEQEGVKGEAVRAS